MAIRQGRGASSPNATTLMLLVLIGYRNYYLETILNGG